MTAGRIRLLTCASLLLLAGVGTAVGAEVWYRSGVSTVDHPVITKLVFQTLSTIPAMTGLSLLVTVVINRPSPRRRRRRTPEIRPAPTDQRRMGKTSGGVSLSELECTTGKARPMGSDPVRGQTPFGLRISGEGGSE